MKLIVGLGNPGSQYAGTRHNVGFGVLAELARRHNSGGQSQTKYKAEFQDVHLAGEKVLLVAPMTYMNGSGESVVQFVSFYKVELEDIVILCDDMNLPCGRIRWRAKGSAGGQKGLDDTIRRLGSNEFPRLRIGIGRPPGKMDVTSWVLGKFREEERPDMELAIVRSADSLEKWVRDGLDATMNAFNRDTET